ncbi:MAG: hypothetical protein IT518_02780, partial [Burkholderiales bacterium]|nr:hypothetical protein [Burkholderiales bacterium]
FATTGATPGIGGTDSSGTRWFTPSTSDTQMMQAVNSLNDQYQALLKALGGTGTAVFAQGFSTDPKGSAQSNVHTGVFGPTGQVFNAENANVGRSPEELKAALEQQSMQAILAALQSSELPSVVHDYLASIDVSTATAEQIRAALAHVAELKALADAVSMLPSDMAANLLSAIGVSDELDVKIAEFAVSFKAFAAAAGELQDQLDRDPQAEAIKAVAAAHATTFEKVGLARDALSEMLTKYDGSTEGTKALTAATGAYIDAQVAALAEINNIKTSLDGMFGNTLRTFELALMDTKAQQGFYVDEALKTVALLKQTTDPQKIAELSKIVNDDLVSAFNLMDPKTQKEQHDYLKGILTDAQAAAGTQLDLAEQSVVDAGTQSQQILDKVQLALDEAADKQREAAQALIDAAQAIKDAAAQQQTAANTNVAAANAQAAAAVAQAAAATAQQTAADTPVAVAVTVYEGSGGP